MWSDSTVRGVCGGVFFYGGRRPLLRTISRGAPHAHTFTTVTEASHHSRAARSALLGQCFLFWYSSDVLKAESLCIFAWMGIGWLMKKGESVRDSLVLRIQPKRIAEKWMSEMGRIVDCRLAKTAQLGPTATKLQSYRAAELQKRALCDASIGRSLIHIHMYPMYPYPCVLNMCAHRVFCNRKKGRKKKKNAREEDEPVR